MPTLAHNSLNAPPQAEIIHEIAILRKDSQDTVEAMLNGWKLDGGWWTRGVRTGDDLASIALHGYARGGRLLTRTTACCIAIDRSGKEAR